MIYQYEAEILSYLHRAIPKVQEMTYAREETLLQAMTTVVRFPAVYFNRTEEEWAFNKVYQILDGNTYTQIVPFEQTYIGHILVENTEEAFDLHTVLRFFWLDNPYLYVNVFEGQDPLKIGLRLLYIKVKEVRAPNDKKGAMREIEFSWKSQIFTLPKEPKQTKLVERVKVYLSTDGSKVLTEGNLIKLIE